MPSSPARVASKYLRSVKPGWLDATADAPLDGLLTELSQRTAVFRLSEACRYAQQAEWDAERQLAGAVRVEDDMERLKRAATSAHAALLEAERAIQGEFSADPDRVDRTLRRIQQSLETLAAWGAHE
jgi:hypothetical protein